MVYAAKEGNTPTPTVLTQQDERQKEAVLTAVDKSVVVLRVCLRAISRPLEVDSSDAFGATSTVKMECDLSQGANGRAEQFLQSDKGWLTPEEKRSVGISIL